MQGANSSIPSLIVGLLLGVIAGFIIRLLYGRLKLQTAESRSSEIIVEAKNEANRLIKKSEAEAKEKLIEAKEMILKERSELDKELRERKNELSAYERRISSREENFERIFSAFEEKQNLVTEKEHYLKIKEDKITEKENKIDRELEKIASLSKEEARRRLEEKLKAEVEDKVYLYFNDRLKESELEADKKAREILVSVMERVVSDLTKEVNITNITLPDDEMKGRIIGREGRNIRTLENLLGVDIIIDDTPEIVTVSGFDPIRREIAKITLERLIKDGRIHPARIEEIFSKVKYEIDQKILDEGNKTLYDLGIHNVPSEVIKVLGRLVFRTSYGQNVLYHSKEVARIAGAIAGELGAKVEIAKKGGLFHDIGKAIYSEEGNKHVEEGIKFLTSMRESEEVIECVAKHHESASFAQNFEDKGKKDSVEAIIVRISDAVSAARPGARYNEGAWEDYIKRVEELEKEALGFEEVEKAFAIQAGREIRLFIKSFVPEDKLNEIALEMKKKIHFNKNIKYPGRIKITVVKESRIVEHTD